MFPDNFSITGVQLDLSQGQHCAVVLQVEPFVRPGLECLDDFFTRAIGIVRGEPDKIQPRAQVSRAKNVSLSSAAASIPAPSRDFRNLPDKSSN